MSTTKLKARPLSELDTLLADPGRVAAMQRSGEWSRFSVEYVAAKHRDQGDNPHAAAEALEALQAGEQAALRSGGPNGRPNLAGGRTAADGGVPALTAGRNTADRLWEAVQASESVRIQNAVIATDDIGADEHSVPLVFRAREPRRLVTAAGIAAQPVDGVTSVDYPVFGAGDAGITAEGSGKVEYDGITPGSATPQMINVWTDYTRQAALTQTTFEARLRTVLASKVARREDVLLVATVVGTTGIQTIDMAAVDPDAVLEGAAKVAAGEVAAEPNLFVFNPGDTEDLFGAEAFGNNAVSDSRQLDFRLHGMRGYPSDAIEAGKILIGAWPAASRFIVGLGPTYLVDATSGIKTNRITTLLEEAVALAVDEPAGFLYLRPDPN